MNKLCEQIIVALLLAVVVGVPLMMSTKIYSVFDLSKITLLYLLTFVLIVVWCVKQIFHRDTFKNNPLMIPIGCIFVISCFATIFSINPVESLLGNYKRYNGLASLMVYLCLFFLIVSYVKKDMLDLFINAIIITACLTCGYGILQSYGIDYFNWNTDYGKRIFSTIGHPAFFSAYLIMILPLVYYQVIKGRWYFLFALVLILTTFYLTKTRATFVGLIISNILFFVLLGKPLIRKHLFKVCLIIGVVLSISTVSILSMKKNPISRMVNDIKIEGSKVKLLTTASTRRYNVLMAVEIIKDYPVLGIGFGTIDDIYIPYMNKVLAKTGGENYKFQLQDRIHSDFFDRTVNTGLLGLCAYLFFIYSYIKMMWSQNGNRLLKVVLCSSLCSYFIQNQFSFGHVPILMLFWFLIGLSVIVCEKKDNEQQIC